MADDEIRTRAQKGEVTFERTGVFVELRNGISPSLDEIQEVARIWEIPRNPRTVGWSYDRRNKEVLRVDTAVRLRLVKGKSSKPA